MHDPSTNSENVSPVTPEASSGRLMGLDGLRALAVALVLAVHARTCEGFPTGGILDQIAGAGGGGVTIFFVLSGFLVTWLLLSEESRSGQICLQRFYLRRAIRILPAALAFLVLVGTVGPSLGLVVDARSFLASTFFVRNFVNIGGTSTDAHFWSLSIEEQFYLLWPFTLVALPKRWRLPFAVGILGLCPVWRQVNMWVFGGNNINWMRTDLRIDSLMTGCFLAIACRDARTSRWIGLLARFPTATFLLGSLGFVIINWGLAPLPRVLRPFEVCLQLQGILLMVMGAVSSRSGPLHWFLNAPPIQWFGRLSYSIYLWQEIFCIGSHRLPFQVFPINLVWTFLAGTASFYLIEGPCLIRRDVWIDFINRILRKARSR